jgi:flagellar hook-length control protein FliK
MARSLLISVQYHCERPPVFSVTTEPTPNASFQGPPPPRSARPDPSPGNDSFAALVDSSTPADINNARGQEQSASQRRFDDAAATAADNRRSRDAAATDRAARNGSDDRRATKQRSDAKGDADTNADPTPRSGARTDTSKAGPAKSTERQDSDEASADEATADPAAPAQQDVAAATTPDPVAVAIITTAAATEASAATPVSGNAAAPLAIAAAAIAASSLAGAAVASSGQAQIDPDAAAPTAAIAPDAAAKTDVQAAAAASAGQPAAPADTTSATDLALAASGAAPAPPKATTPLKAPVAQTGIATSDDPDAAPGTADPFATATSPGAPASNVAQQQPVDAKPRSGHAAVDAAKADDSAAAPATSAAPLSANAHSELAHAGQAPTNSSDPGVQAAGMIQPQLHAAPATTTATGPLSVTAATDAAVPLSGLALEIAASARSGKSRFEIRLDPADLGRIDVRIDVDRNGRVTSHLMVERPETLSMLRQDAPQLQRALDDAGLATGNGGLQFSLRDQSSSGQNDGNGSAPNAHRLIVAEEDSIPAVAAGRTYRRMLGSSGGVDIRV